MTDDHEVTSMADATDLHVPAAPGRSPADAAVRAADLAARSAGVRIREITELDDLEAVHRLYDTIWRPDPSNPPVTTEMLRALTKAGNHVAGAFEGSRLVGACVAFFYPPADGAMHSHIAGVSPVALGRGVGYALKLDQRAWAMLSRVSTITWTFDPLVGRNAYFNLVKLAAVPAEYLPDFYGAMHDGINGGGATDRLLVRWNLGSPEVVAACAGRPAPRDAEAERLRGAVTALARSADGRPLPGDLDGTTVLVAVPQDIEALRSADPGLGREWRVALRAVLASLMADGARVAGFDRAGWYVLTREGAR